MLTNLGLVEFAKKALEIKAGYVYGTTGQILTENLLAYKQDQYPDHINRFIDYIKQNYMGKITYDCVGLIKGYIWQNDEHDGWYDPSNDVSANGMFNVAKVKGPIATMPDVPGLCVRYDGHIGVYVGDGKVIEARGTKYGVVQTELEGRGWTHWLECPFILYVKPDTEIIKKGSKGEKVISIQRDLNALGSNLTVDGDFGPKTEEVVKAFQESQKIDVTGQLTKAELKLLTVMVQNRSLTDSIIAHAAFVKDVSEKHVQIIKILEGLIKQ